MCAIQSNPGSGSEPERSTGRRAGPCTTWA